MSPAKPAVGKVQKQMIWSRMLKAARFDAATFIELKLDERANWQAVAVLAFASLSYGIGSAFSTGGGFGLSILIWMILFFLTFSFLSITAFLVGTRFLHGITSFTGLVRPVFFSTSPGPIFLLLSIVPLDVGNVFAAVLWGWVLVAGIYAVKHAMGFSIQKSMLAFIVFALAWFAILSAAFSTLAVYLIGAGA